MLGPVAEYYSLQIMPTTFSLGMTCRALLFGRWLVFAIKFFRAPTNNQQTTTTICDH